jgi:hypothetical protein
MPEEISENCETHQTAEMLYRRLVQTPAGSRCSGLSLLSDRYIPRPCTQGGLSRLHPLTYAALFGVHNDEE